MLSLPEMGPLVQGMVWCSGTQTHNGVIAGALT